MLVICSVTDTLNTNYYGTTFGGMPGSFNSSQINDCVDGIGVLGPLFQRTWAAQIVAPEGIQTQHLPHARQAPYPLVTAPPSKLRSWSLKMSLMAYIGTRSK